ncbi:glycosyltransferase family 39 protein [Rhizobium sp. ZPR3]|uniref:Glycosyltransferase family 39 protein n=2 Tax=unclassified Rhizobium TaxID=2613769 RepID=A0AAU7SHF8_9HYPH
MQTAVNTIFRRPTNILWLLIAFQLVVLTIIPTAFSSAPPLDVVEGWTWAPHWLIGTYKHPPGPAWSIEIMHYLIPGYLFGPYLLSQIAVALTYLFVYLAGCVFTDKWRALAGTLLLAGSLYFNYFTTQFNHNVLQLPFWSAIILVFAHILRKPARTSLWIILGILVGAGMYAKYSVCVIAITAAIAGVVFSNVRAQLKTPRPYLAITIAGLIFLPHVVWLFQTDFLTFKYVSDRTAGRRFAEEPFIFLLMQILNHIPMLLLLSCVGFSALSVKGDRESSSSTKSFFRLFTFTPLAMLIIGALLTGKGLVTMWGMPMFTTVGLWVVAEIDSVWNTTMIKRLTIGAVTFVSLVGTVFIGEAVWSKSHKPQRTSWPMQELAEKANSIWKAEVDTPLQITGGSMWLAGLVSLGLPQRPNVAVDRDLRLSPWVTASDVATKGMLYMSDTKDDQLPPYCTAHGPSHPIRLSNSHIPLIFATVCYSASTLRTDFQYTDPRQ